MLGVSDQDTESVYPIKKSWHEWYWDRWWCRWWWRWCMDYNKGKAADHDVLLWCNIIAYNSTHVLVRGAASLSDQSLYTHTRTTLFFPLFLSPLFPPSFYYFYTQLCLVQKAKSTTSIRFLLSKRVLSTRFSSRSHPFLVTCHPWHALPFCLLLFPWLNTRKYRMSIKMERNVYAYADSPFVLQAALGSASKPVHRDYGIRRWVATYASLGEMVHLVLERILFQPCTQRRMGKEAIQPYLGRAILYVLGWSRRQWWNACYLWASVASSTNHWFLHEERQGQHVFQWSHWTKDSLLQHGIDLWSSGSKLGYSSWSQRWDVHGH